MFDAQLYHFQRYDRSLKLEEITAAVVEELRIKCAECECGNIDRPSFVCYPESPSHVTYRARLEGTSERGSDSLISLIEDWVSGGPGVIVTGVLMTVDRHCSVAISFLSERECLPPPANTTDPPITDPPITDPPITDPPITDPPITDPPTADSPTTDSPNATTEDPNTDPPVTDPITDPTATVIGDIETPDTGATPETTTGIIAGAAAAVVIVLIITIAIVIIVFLVLKSRRGEFAVKKSDRKYVHYCTLYLHLYDYTLKWNLSSMDTNEAEQTNYSSLQSWYLGWEKVSCLEKFGVS